MVELQIKVEPPQLQRVREQELGVESGRIGSMLLEEVGRELQDLNDRQVAAAWLSPFSCAALSAAVNADTRPSRPPVMKRSSLCKDRVIQLSVTWFSLKLNVG